VIVGSLIERTVLSPVWAKAASRAFAWLSVLALLVSGVVLFWLFPRTGARAAEIPGERPWRSALVGTLVVLLPPLLMLPLFLSLVGVPLAVLLLLAWLVVLFLGPIPAVTWAGRRLLRGKGGVAGGLVLGVILWRGAMWILPLVAAVLYLAALVVGVGGFVLAAWEVRGQAEADGGDWRPMPPVTENG
jgi:hypothetical protein